MDKQSNPQLTQYDTKEQWRCPQLGGPVTFNYCRRMNAGIPCRLLFRCWGNQIDVQAYVDANFSEEVIQEAFCETSKGRLGAVFDVLNQVVPKKNEDC